MCSLSVSKAFSPFRLALSDLSPCAFSSFFHCSSYFMLSYSFVLSSFRLTLFGISLLNKISHLLFVCSLHHFIPSFVHEILSSVSWPLWGTWKGTASIKH